MKKRILASLMAVIAMAMTTDVYAATVVGKVLDASSKEPMEFVNVTIRKVGAARPLPMGVTTDSAGVFTLNGIAPGRYIVKLSYVGYTAALKNVSLASDADVAQIGSLSLSENSKVLKEVEVLGMKSQVRFDLDKKVFNVDQNIAAAGASASEVLETIPSVEVDNDGGVSLRGNSSVTIWINGKPSGMTADNRGQILEQLPAESIEKVEVITNPSAKYSPEGTAGIINIVLKQDRKAGYYGSIQAGADSRGGFNVGANVNYNSGRWDSFVNVGVRGRRRPGTETSWRTYRDDTFLNSFADNSRHNNTLFLRAGTTYSLTKHDSFYLNGFAMIGGGGSTSNITYRSNVPGSFSSGLSNTDADMKNRGGDIDFGFTHKWGESNSIDASVSYSLWRMPNNSYYHREYTYPDSVVASWQQQDNHIKVNNWNFQLDYEAQVSKLFKLQAGYKGTLSYEDSPLSTYSGSQEGNLSIDKLLYNRFIYDQDIQAAYATFGGKVTKEFNFMAGLRGEYWHNEAKSLAYGEVKSLIPAHTADKFALFPSLFLSYSLPHANELQVNYTRRIQRPWGGQLNSFVNITDPTNISYGNPDLKPQYSNSFELNYIKTWTDHILSVSGYYRTTDNVIQRISFMKDGVLNTTSENVSQSLATGAEIVLKDRLFKRLDLTTTVNLYYNRMDGFSYLPAGMDTPVTGVRSDKFMWDANIMASVLLPWGLTFQANAKYTAKSLVAQGYMKPQYRADAGLKKNFGKWSASINVRDIFDSRKWETVIDTQSYHLESVRKGGGRRLNFTLTYSFGNAGAKKKPGSKKTPDSEPQSGYDMGGGED